MIYGRWGNEVTIVRLGTLADVPKYDHRRVDADDEQMVEQGSYVVTRSKDGHETLAHIAYLRADGGLEEIIAAIEAAKRVGAAP
jgi:hypothetical protein